MGRCWQFRAVGVMAVLGALSMGGCRSSAGEAGNLLQSLERAPAEKKAQPSQSFRFDMMVVKKGQFTQYLVKEKSGETKGVRFEVIGAGDMPLSQWFEVEILTRSERTIVRLLALIDDARLAVAQQQGEGFEPVLQDYNRIVRARLWTSGDSSSQLVEPDMLPRAVAGWGDVFLLKNLKISGRENVEVKAGKFRCHKGTSDANFLGAKGTWHLCLDSQVPLNGFAEAVDAAGRKWELVSFGAGGSKVPVPDVFP